MMRDESILVRDRILPPDEKQKAFAIFQLAIANPKAVSREKLIETWDFLRPFLRGIHRDDRKRMRRVLKLNIDDASVDELPSDEAFAANDPL